MKGLGGLIPDAGAFQTDRQVEPALRVLWLETRERAVALGGGLIAFQLELNVAHGAEDLGAALIGRGGALQLIERFLTLAGEVERDGAG